MQLFLVDLRFLRCHLAIQAAFSTSFSAYFSLTFPVATPVRKFTAKMDDTRVRFARLAGYVPGLFELKCK